MVSKKSYFNFTIFRNNIARHWPIWTGYLFLLIFTGPFSLFMSHTNQSFSNKTDFMIGLSTSMSIMASPIIMSVFIILSALAVFSYQYSARSAYAIHALPVSREGLFLTNYMSGFAYLIVPQIINYIFMVLVTLGIHSDYVDNLHPWVLSCIFVTFFLYSTMVMFCMFTGNFFWPPVLYLIFNLLYIGVKVLVLGLGQLLLYGITSQESVFSESDSILSPLYYLNAAHTFQTTAHGSGNLEIIVQSTRFYLPYAIAAIIIVSIAFLLYKHRSIECVGDVLSYKIMRPFFLWLSSLCVVSLLTVSFISFFFHSELYMSEYSFRIVFIFVAVFSFLCFFMIEMIIKKRFRVFTKKKVMESFLFTGLALVSLCMIRYDVFHLESKIPSAKEISNVEINYLYETKLTDSPDIEYARSLQKQLLAQKNKTIFDSKNIHTITLTYNLKNGHTLKRLYPFVVSSSEFNDPQSIPSKTSLLFNNYSRILHLIGMENPENIKETKASIYTPEEYDPKTDRKTMTPNQNLLNRDADQKQLLSLLNAYLKDIEEGHIQAFPTHLKDSEKEHYYTSVLSLNYSIPKTSSSYTDSNGFFSDYSLNSSVFIDATIIDFNLDIHFNDQCTNLLKVLESNGIYKSDLSYVKLKK